MTNTVSAFTSPTTARSKSRKSSVSETDHGHPSKLRRQHRPKLRRRRQHRQRLIDIPYLKPSGHRFAPRHYWTLVVCVTTNCGDPVRIPLQPRQLSGQTSNGVLGRTRFSVQTVLPAGLVEEGTPGNRCDGCHSEPAEEVPATHTSVQFPSA